MKTIGKLFNSLYRSYKKSTLWFKLLLIICILLILSTIYTTHRRETIKEGFIQKDKFVIKEGPDVFDNFYVSVYDDLTFDALKNKFEVGEIMRAAAVNPKKAIVLDIGSSTGEHVNALVKKGCQAYGMDSSEEMVKLSKKKFPELNFKHADALTALAYPSNSFTLINCLYFTIYYIKNKRTFFQNCYNWLMPGGYLALHLVNRDKFDPILNVADPLVMVSPQKYAKERITNSVIKFNDFQYKANFKLNKDDNTAEFDETLKDDATGKVRKNKHEFYMPTQKEVLALAKDMGFILKGRIDMVACQYEYQYIYLLYKPE